MATTTPNFGWAVPTSTDLVKDGAVAIETLGDSIDASLVDLKGGTTGQVLSKTTSTDMDFTWVDAQTGDITGITAGTGISGGGTSGTVTVTNSMATAIDAKGDLVVGTGSDTFSRLGVGSDNQVLTADSTAATGVKWATAGGGTTLPTFRAYSNEDQSISANTMTKKLYQVEDWDTASCFASSRFTPNVAGYYVLTATQYNPDAGTISLFFYKNGSNNASGPSGGTPGFRAQNTTIMYFNGTTDYAEVYVNSNQTSLYNGSANAYFTAVGVRS